METTASCCTSVSVVLLSAGAIGAQKGRAGDYSLILESGPRSDGKPVYKHATTDYYLYYWPAYKDWLIGVDYTRSSGNIQSVVNALGENATCPDWPSANPGKYGSWYYWDHADGWSPGTIGTDVGISVTLWPWAVQWLHSRAATLSAPPPCIELTRKRIRLMVGSPNVSFPNRNAQPVGASSAAPRHSTRIVSYGSYRQIQTSWHCP